MHHFEYRGDELYAEDVSVREIAEAVGTPTYVYSYATLERHYQVFDAALAGEPHLICFSMKANSNLAVLMALVGWGAGLDIVSGGELFRALRAGVDPRKIVFSGVGKREDEIESALGAGILAFNVESRDELEAIDHVAGRLGKRAPISMRVNPDVDAQTHPYISTGLKQNKFGVPVAQARQDYRWAAGRKSLEVVGIDCHIGSQLTDIKRIKNAMPR